MPKTQASESVLHDWVHKLPFQMQALLLTGVRGPDNTSKHNTAKMIIRYLRGAVIKPAGDWNGKNNNDFMWGEYIQTFEVKNIPNKGPVESIYLFDDYSSAFWNDHDEYPHHFIMHLIHCAQVIGYYHPNIEISSHWNQFYLRACESLHMNPESKLQMDNRLNDFGVGVHNNGYIKQ